MKKLTKIINIMKKGPKRHLYISLHFCSEEEVDNIVKAFPKDFDLTEGSATNSQGRSTRWVSGSTRPCDDFEFVSITIFRPDRYMEVKKEEKEEVKQ